MHQSYRSGPPAEGYPWRMRTVDVVGIVGGIVGVAAAVFALLNVDSSGPRIAIVIVIAILLAQLLRRLADIPK